MPIVGMRIVSIEGKRGKPSDSPNININSMPKVTDVREIDLSDFDRKALALNFNLSTTYEPATPNQPKKEKEPPVGRIMMAGELVYLPENAQDVIKHWESSKNLPEKIRVEVINHLFRSCLLRMANIAEELQLPLPLTLPRIEPKAETEQPVTGALKKPKKKKN